MNKKYVIDRFEGEFAVLVDEEELTYNIDKRLVSNANEGDVICISIDENAAKEKLNEIEKLMNKLFEN